MRVLKATNPALLDKFFDAPREPTERPGAAYAPQRSWAGQSTDPEPFSRLDTTSHALGLQTRSSGLAGKRVVELEDAPAGGVLSFGRAARDAARVPLTEAQEVAAGTDGHCCALIDAARFENLHVVPERLVPTAGDVYEKRIALAESGRLTTPAERRETLDIEVKKLRADGIRRKAAGEAKRLGDLMRWRHPDGVLGVDSTANQKSAVYEPAATRLIAKADRSREIACARREHLAKKTVAKDRLGYDPFHHDATKRDEESTFLQRRAAHPPYADTHLRVFQKHEVVFNPRRAQQLRDYDLNGKHYDIVTHTVHEVLPPSTEERVNKRLAHPSQNSLERGRNLQGSFLPRGAIF
ncbi:hypothetical protein CTAYLR_009236 [Chrysophaeum taylorii]|uniref:Uncharacterized protein n=1 Tax=Chrysophaeum taylorii TaxID=2483200 RepID=A0AAD7UF33_9STRA|nr:hypothetical protein CTAYLR_009236 [Chrysophaeum taylorii]